MREGLSKDQPMHDRNRKDDQLDPLLTGSLVVAVMCFKIDFGVTRYK